MKTKEELIEWLKLREKECIDLSYELIDSLNEPEIDVYIRLIRDSLYKFEQSVNRTRNAVTNKMLG